MRKLILAGSLGALFTFGCFGAELQGVIADWNCTQDMVQHGRAKVLKDRRDCSLTRNFRRSAYGLITDDKKFYKIDPQSNPRVIEVLSNSPDKDNLRVIITGDLQGNNLKIDTISIL
jgi:hypothetical protein